MLLEQKANEAARCQQEEQGSMLYDTVASGSVACLSAAADGTLAHS
jgi:hypothetical protein